MSQNENQSKKKFIVFKTVLIECRKIKTSIVPTTTNMITQW